MIYMLPIHKIIAAIAIVYAFLCSLVGGFIWWITDEQLTTLKAATLTFSGSLVLQAVLLLWVHLGWRWFWKRFPVFGRLIYPDISGRWEMAIKPSKHNAQEIKASADIRQDFLRISMDVTAPKSHSETLVAVPRKQPSSSQPLLYYIYLVTTFPDDGPSYTYQGAAILEFDRGGSQELAGNYWTSSHTSGRFRLSNRRPLPIS